MVYLWEQDQGTSRNVSYSYTYKWKGLTHLWMFPSYYNSGLLCWHFWHCGPNNFCRGFSCALYDFSSVSGLYPPDASSTESRDKSKCPQMRITAWLLLYITLWLQGHRYHKACPMTEGAVENTSLDNVKGNSHKSTAPWLCGHRQSAKKKTICFSDEAAKTIQWRTNGPGTATHLHAKEWRQTHLFLILYTKLSTNDHNPKCKS